MPGGEHERTGGEHPAAVALGQRGARIDVARVRDRQDREHEPRVQRAQPAAQLQVQRQDEEERRLSAPEHELGDEAGGQAAGANSAAAAAARRRAREAPLLDRNAPRMAGAAASDSQVHSGQPWARPSTSGRTIAVSPRVASTVPARSSDPSRSARLGIAAAPAHRERADGDVDEKAAAPAEAATLACTSTPPISWPDTAAKPMVMP